MKNLKRILALCLVAVSFVFLAGFASDNSAAVIKDNGCTLFTPWGIGFTDASITVANNGGNVMLTCQFEGLENPTGKVYHESGFLCGIALEEGGVYTENTSMVITPSGQGTLKCMVKKPKL